MLCISLRSSIKYPEDACIRQYHGRQKLTTVCFPVAELLWFCGQFHINYCFVCKQMWGGFWEKQHTQRMVVAGMCPIMMVNRLWVGPLQWDQILQSDKKKKKKDQTMMDILMIYKHTVTLSMESWTLVHSFQASSQTKSVTWRLLHRATNSASLSLCLVCEDSTVCVTASQFCSIKSPGTNDNSLPD